MEIPDVHIPAKEPGSFSFQAILSRRFEKIKWQHRAEKYRYKEDKGGIGYIRKNVKPGNTVFDIGAHKAGYLYYFLEQLKGSGKIYAFEPQSLLASYLLRMKHLLGWENVTVEPIAVSSCEGKAILCIPYNHGKNSSPCATIIETQAQFIYQRRQEVQTISLDEYCRHLRIIPDFIKVDVEGNELAVFRGAEKILRASKPKVLFECEARFVGEQRMKETFSYLTALGYTGYFIMDDTLHPIEDFEPSKHQRERSTPYCNNFIFE